MTKLYMAVTPDEYELPMIVEENIEEFARESGKTVNSIMSSISKQKSGKYNGMKFIRIKVEESE